MGSGEKKQHLLSLAGALGGSHRERYKSGWTRHREVFKPTDSVGNIRRQQHMGRFDSRGRFGGVVDLDFGQLEMGSSKPISSNRPSRRFDYSHGYS
jgi:hypothetical protein